MGALEAKASKSNDRRKNIEEVRRQTRTANYAVLLRLAELQEKILSDPTEFPLDDLQWLLLLTHKLIAENGRLIDKVDGCIGLLIEQQIKAGCKTYRAPLRRTGGV